MKSISVYCLTALLAVSMAEELTRLAPKDAHGDTIVVRGRVFDGEGRPVTNAAVFAYHADHEGEYHDDAYRGTVHTDEHGSYAFETSRPGGYGPAPHIHFEISGAGLRKTRAHLRLGDESVPRRSTELRGSPVEEFTFDIRVER